MKILVVSLLRLGDIIQQIPLLKGLRARDPEVKIHLLINKQFADVQSLLGDLVDSYHYFDRQSLQRSLGESSYNILWPVSLVKNQIAQLRAEDFDQVYNFTHTKLSAYLIGLIGKPTRGLSYKKGKFQGLENRWMRYFNDHFSSSQRSHFHYVEALGGALQIPLASSSLEARPFLNSEKTVFFQCLTSDSKKNWGLEKFAQLKKAIEVSLVDYSVKILGADFEEERLLTVFEKSDLIICDLSEAQEHLKRARLLVTGDTSIKHLAAQLGTPIVELVLGSSDFTKTRAFAVNSVAVKTKAPCAPCAHSAKCSQPHQICAEDISVDEVFKAVWDVLSQRPFSPVFDEVTHFERLVWKSYLDQGVLKMDMKISSKTLVDLQSLQNQFQIILSDAESAIQKLELFEKKPKLQTQDISEIVLIVQNMLKRGLDQKTGYFQGLIDSLISKFNSPQALLQRMQDALSQAGELIAIRKNLITQLTAQSMEGHFYAEGIGRLSESSFTEVGTGPRRNSQDAEL